MVSLHFDTRVSSCLFRCVTSRRNVGSAFGNWVRGGCVFLICVYDPKSCPAPRGKKKKE
jgi:hypothetical protein